MISEEDKQMLKAYIMTLMLYMKTHGYGPYKEMSYSQIEQRAICGVTGEMTQKEHMILVMF